MSRPVGLCGKVRYRTRKGAWADALRMYDRMGWELSAYVCHNCGGFHLTSKYRHSPPRKIYGRLTRVRLDE